jgi:hypothetical protein
MSADPQAFDPYRSPPPPELSYAGGSQSARPGLLTIVCVICIVLGALGLINSLAGAVGLVGGRQFQAAFRVPSGVAESDEMKDARKDFQDQMFGVLTRYWWAIITAVALRFLLAVLLLVGGIKALNLNETGRKILLTACVIALPLELGYAILQTFMQLENMTAMNSFAESLGQSMPQNQANANVGKTMQYIFRASMIASIAFATLLALGKIAFYTFSVIYLQRQRIRALFQRVVPATLTSDS